MIRYTDRVDFISDMGSRKLNNRKRRRHSFATLISLYRWKVNNYNVICYLSPLGLDHLGESDIVCWDFEVKLNSLLRMRPSCMCSHKFYTIGYTWTCYFIMLWQLGRSKYAWIENLQQSLNLRMHFWRKFVNSNFQKISIQKLLHVCNWSLWTAHILIFGSQ
jgi:hypothetical protein